MLDFNAVGPVIAVRPYCHTDHYWQLCFDTNEAILRVAEEAGWPAQTPTPITLVPHAQAPSALGDLTIQGLTALPASAASGVAKP